MAAPVSEPVHAGLFYAEYHGHCTRDLKAVQRRLFECAGVSKFIYLAGDSSFDNKHWFFDLSEDKERQMGHCSDFVAKAVNGFQTALNPPHMVMDINYFMNKECESRRAAGTAPVMACLNCAVEESCIVQRETDGLLPQDEYIRDNLTEDDVLVVDVGGNDVALRPTCGVVANMAWLLYLTPQCFIETSPFLAPGLWYFIYMFRVRLRNYVEKLIAVRKPRKVVICMLYFLDEKPGGSWADRVLHTLGYDSNPSKLQAVIRQIYEWGVSQIEIPGTEVVALPLYETLDGKDTGDYAHRVEPSVQGGEKMAKAIAASIFD